MRNYEARNNKGRALTRFEARDKNHALRIARDWNEHHASPMLKIADLIDVTPTTGATFTEAKAEEREQEAKLGSLVKTVNANRLR